MKLLTIDVGGTELKYGVMDDEINITHKGYVPTPKTGFDEFAQVIFDIYKPVKNEVEGIAISLPGFIDTEKGYVYAGGALTYNGGVAVGPLLEEKCGCRVVLENDGKAAAAAEFYKGSLQGCQNAAVCVLGTAVGGGLIIDGKVVRGKDCTAGEFSFMITDASDFHSPDAYVAMNCSTSGLLNMYRSYTHTDEKIDGREFFRRLPDDPFAQRTLDEFASNLAKLFFNLYFLLDVEKIAVGGGISRQVILTEKIREKFQEVRSECPFSSFITRCSLEIVTCAFHNDANLIGAYMTYQQMMAQEH